jgi:flagellar biosynthesis/type III secretory pathway chaperone
MLRDIPSSALKQLVRLSERKEALMARIQQIDREMMRVQNKFGIPSREGGPRAPVRYLGRLAGCFGGEASAVR